MDILHILSVRASPLTRIGYLPMAPWRHAGRARRATMQALDVEWHPVFNGDSGHPTVSDWDTDFHRFPQVIFQSSPNYPCYSVFIRVQKRHLPLVSGGWMVIHG
jgi:hypothetical protein